MKKFSTIFLTAMFILNSVVAQSKMDDVVNVLNRSSIENIIHYFDNVVDITVNNNQTTYSKSQAEMVLRKFFTKNAVTSFQITLKDGTVDKESFYLIGEMKTNGHGKFRVFFQFKSKGKDYYLQEMKIQ